MCDLDEALGRLKEAKLKTTASDKPHSHSSLAGRRITMSDHQLKFKGFGFDFSANGWMAILAAIVIVALILVLPRLWQ
jgi:hypothetical protein